MQGCMMSHCCSDSLRRHCKDYEYMEYAIRTLLTLRGALDISRSLSSALHALNRSLDGLESS